MTADQRERLRIVVQQGILVRRGARIDEEVAEERARNLVTIIELMVNDFKAETTDPGPNPRTDCPGCGAANSLARVPAGYFCTACRYAFDAPEGDSHA